MLFRIHSKTAGRISSSNSLAIITVSLFLLVLLGWIDYLTGEYSMIVFYLIPVSLVAWALRWHYGIIFCFLTVITRFFADEASSSFSLISTTLHYWNLFIEFLFLLIMSVLFSFLRKSLDSEKSRTSSDPLTGALNRHEFFDLAGQVLNRSRHHNQATTIAYIDVDNFKSINDRMGHTVGDNLLATVTGTISTIIRDTGTISRFGGDEFVLLLPETPAETAAALLEKIHAGLNRAMSVKKWPVSFSIGAVTYSTSPPGAEEAIKKADMLMHEVKCNGKNRLLHIEATEAGNG